MIVLLLERWDDIFRMEMAWIEPGKLLGLGLHHGSTCRSHGDLTLKILDHQTIGTEPAKNESLASIH